MVAVVPEVHSRLKTYSDITGIPMQKVVTQALVHWLDTVGTAHMEILANKQHVAAMVAHVATPAEEPYATATTT